MTLLYLSVNYINISCSTTKNYFQEPRYKNHPLINLIWILWCHQGIKYFTMIAQISKSGNSKEMVFAINVLEHKKNWEAGTEKSQWIQNKNQYMLFLWSDKSLNILKYVNSYKKSWAVEPLGYIGSFWCITLPLLNSITYVLLELTWNFGKREFQVPLSYFWIFSNLSVEKYLETFYKLICLEI